MTAPATTPPAARTDTVLSLRGITKTFGAVAALTAQLQSAGFAEVDLLVNNAGLALGLLPVVSGALAYVLVRTVGRWHWRALIVVASVLVVLLIALSSLYLGATLFSDALIAMLEGAAWLLFCISGVEIVRWREKAQREIALTTREEVGS